MICYLRLPHGRRVAHAARAIRFQAMRFSTHSPAAGRDSRRGESAAQGVTAARGDGADGCGGGSTSTLWTDTDATKERRTSALTFPSQLPWCAGYSRSGSHNHPWMMPDSMSDQAGENPGRSSLRAVVPGPGRAACSWCASCTARRAWASPEAMAWHQM